MLAGIYRFEDVMSQAAEILKDETDWMPGDEGGFGSVALSEAVPIVIPDPPPVIHTYTTCTLLPFDIIPTNEEEDARDVAIGSVITLLEPHQAQITYRNSVKAFLARVVRRTLGAKVYETGLHALNCFLPDDPIRLTVLLGRTNVYIDTWLPALTEKLSILADIGCDNGKFLLAEMMQPLEDDCNAIEDIQPLTEHTVSHVHVTSGNLPRQGRIFSDIEDTNVEIDSNSLSSVRFLSFLDEIANLVGKNELFKRSLLLIRGWWLYETATYGGGSTKTLLTDQSLCVLVCSIFNQHHAILHQPLQVLSIFLSEYCELDWNNCAVTVQGIVPFRPVVNKSDADLLSVSVTDLESSSETSAQLTSQVTVEITEPWLRYPVETDLLSVAFLQKYAEVVKSTKPSAAAKSPAASGLMLISPMSSCKDTDIFTMNSMGMHSTDSMNDMSNSSTANPSASISRAGSSDSSAFYQLGSLHSDGPDSPMRRTASTLVIEEAPLFERGAINIVNPLNQSNMTVSAITSEKASVITQIFEIGARNLNQALKLSQGEHINVQAPFNRFFRAVLLRFRDNWRPDVFKGSQSMCQYAGGTYIRIAHYIVMYYMMSSS